MEVLIKENDKYYTFSTSSGYKEEISKGEYKEIQSKFNDYTEVPFAWCQNCYFIIKNRCLYACDTFGGSELAKLNLNRIARWNISLKDAAIKVGGIKNGFIPIILIIGRKKVRLKFLYKSGDWEVCKRVAVHG